MLGGVAPGAVTVDVGVAGEVTGCWVVTPVWPVPVVVPAAVVMGVGGVTGLFGEVELLPPGAVVELLFPVLPVVVLPSEVAGGATGAVGAVDAAGAVAGAPAAAPGLEKHRSPPAKMETTPSKIAIFLVFIFLP